MGWDGMGPQTINETIPPRPLIFHFHFHFPFSLPGRWALCEQFNCIQWYRTIVEYEVTCRACIAITCSLLVTEVE
jgi:hypothetical protein